MSCNRHAAPDNDAIGGVMLKAVAGGVTHWVTCPACGGSPVIFDARGKYKWCSCCPWQQKPARDVW